MLPMLPMTKDEAQAFADDWIAAWNAHDIDRIMSHYAEDVEYASVFLTRLTDNVKGCLQGKAAVRDYLLKGLAAYPELNFKLISVYAGMNSVVLNYQSVNGLLAAEVFELNAQGQAVRVLCHYNQ